MFELNVPELDKILKDMRELAPKLQRKGLTQALRKGMAPVRKSARAKLRTHIEKTEGSESTKRLEKSIIVRANSRLGRREGGAAMQVGVRGGGKENPNTAFYFRFLEFGTSKMAARPFLVPAMVENQKRVSDIVTTELRAAIDRIARTGK